MSNLIGPKPDQVPVNGMLGEAAYMTLGQVQANTVVGGNVFSGIIGLTRGPCLQKTGSNTIQIRAGAQVVVGSTLITFTTATPVALPTLYGGENCAVWVKSDMTIQATENFTSPPGGGSWQLIGGFHYAPGGNAVGRNGGNTTPAINEYSIWDWNWRPACADPRGMALVANGFWADIYLCGTGHHVSGTSKYNVTIADGVSLPKVPTAFGGNGGAAYTDCNWWTAGEILAAYGKRMPSYAEFAALSFGTTEATSAGSNPENTILHAASTSRWGVMQSTGNMWIWGVAHGGNVQAAEWAANTGGRGSTYMLTNAVLLGGSFESGATSGSRASGWATTAMYSSGIVGLRGVCDHFCK